MPVRLSLRHLVFLASCRNC
uniref:Uncharacterized protein n=1 Tax=Rhizophora mucronata TaxID=61149 RepID=A0A2P2KLC8_RHIMU